ncbi:MAG: CDP-diacylglycerol--serine O-phosphatidyltransferase [Gemmatimonadetes bacterium]|jgi:CDP-diacylglycerol---serine O-phosphatidyltransferase|nr:CDP-diacylglycerol--serine O-phosphatidyltransferase [Gemmatimonadota bacterium]
MYRSFIPSLFTIGNLFCGFLSLHYIFQGNFVPAAWLIVLGAVFDKMDGKIARAMGKDSQFGIEFDSIVDICTFGVAPAVMIYQSYLHHPWGMGIAFIYLLCGAIRLARFNVMSLNEEKGDYYMGVPIPMAAITLTQYVVFTERAWASAHASALAGLLVLALAGLMVSRFDYDSMPDFRGTGFGERFKQIYFFTGVGLVIYSAEDFCFPLVILYILSGIYRWVVGLFHDEVTQHA